MIRLIKTYTKGYVFISYLGPCFKLLEALIEVFIPLLIAAIVDKGIANADKSLVWWYGGLVLALYFVGFIFSAICQYLAAKSAFGFGTNLRAALFDKINSLPLSDIDFLGASTLVHRVGTDVNNVQNMLNRVIRLVTRAPFLLVGALIMAVYISPKLSIIFFFAALLLSVTMLLVMRFSTPRLKNIAKTQDEITLLTRQSLAGAKVIRAFNQQEAEQAEFDKSNRRLKKQSLLLGVISAVTSPVSYLIINAAILLVVYFGSFEVDAGNLTQGKIIALTNYLLQILNAMVVLALLVTLFTKATVSSKRICAVLDLESEQDSGIAFTHDMTNAESAIEFNNVSMAYKGNSGCSLKNISLTLKKGGTLGIIGSTGSGKTTLVSLLTKLYDYTGSITLFGQELSGLSAKSVRENVAVVPQKSVLFSGTVKENLLMANPSASEEMMKSALDMARCAFVGSLSAPVSRGGGNLSGGQRQRLCIARALIKNAPLLILDDSMSALDYSTESEIKAALNQIDAAKIIVSQRASSIKNADVILVIEGGVAVGVGTHDQLVSSCDVYREINEIQGGGYEKK